MAKRLRMVAMGLVGALGMAAALALGAGASDIKACVSQSGVVTPAGPTGRCLAGQSSMAISGNFFKSTKRGTITINGVDFKESSRGRTLTINGTAFKGSSRGGTLTINGTAFKGSSRGQTLTINGTSFRPGALPGTITLNGVAIQQGTLPQTLTINGNSFRSSGNTLTINQTVFGPGAGAAQGPAGAPGPQGPEGKPGTAAAGRAPVEVVGPVVAESGAAKRLVALQFTGTEPRRLLLSGGFDVECSLCKEPSATPSWELRMEGAQGALVRRRIAPLSDGQQAGASISEIVVTPAVCGPCTYTLALSVPLDAAGGSQTMTAHAMRLGLVDLGPVAP